MNLPALLGKHNSVKRQGQQSWGFTLIELMVAVTVASIMLSVSVPMVAVQLRSMALRNLVYQVAGDLQIVKSQAIRTQANCQIIFDSINNQYTLSDPNRMVDLSNFRGNITFAANPDGGTNVFSPAIGFTPRGISALVPPATTQIYVTNQDNRLFRIQASAVGAISIREYNPATNSWI